ncbi:MAG: tetratricopeptide repeat protein [Anaerolineae bacterium]|nr:tetratricopeptide repeat protein [Anaerolineae bacterium]
MIALSQSRLMEAKLDHAEHYLRLLQACEAAYVQSANPLDALTPELPQIQQAQAWCATYSARLPQAARLMTDFGLIDAALMELGQDAPTQLAWYQAGWAVAEGDDETRARLSLNLGVSYARLGQYAQALACLTEALAVPTPTVSARLRARLLNAMGDVQVALGESPQAVETFTQSLGVLTEPCDELAQAHFGLANAYTNMSHIEHAQTHYRHSLALYESTAANTPKRAQIYARMGELAYSTGDYPTARQYQEHCLRLAERMNHPRALTMAYRNLAYIANDEGNLAEAEQHFEAGLRHCKQLGDLREYAILQGGLGQSYWRAGRTDDAVAAFQRSLDASEQTGDQIGIAYTLTNLSRIWGATGDRQRAIDSLQRARTILAGLDDIWGQAKVLLELGSLTLGHDDQRALDSFEQMLVLVEGIGDARGQALAQVRLASVHVRLGQLDRVGALIRQGLSVMVSLGFRSYIADGWLVVARWWQAVGRHDEALGVLGYVLNLPQLSEPLMAEADDLLRAYRSAMPADQVERGLWLGAQRPEADWLAVLGT